MGVMFVGFSLAVHELNEKMNVLELAIVPVGARIGEGKDLEEDR